MSNIERTDSFPAVLSTTEGDLVARVTIATRDEWGDPVLVIVRPRKRPRGWSYDECVRAMQIAVIDGRVRP